MSTTVDLRQLAIQREPETTRPRPRQGRSHFVTRYLLPGLVILGFAGLLLWALRSTLLPVHPVTVMPVLTSRGAGGLPGTPLFQAAGWVEPRPTPSVVTALAEGVVEQLLVVEGQPVEAGQPVARLIEIDSKYALQSAEASIRLRQAELTNARAAVDFAKRTLEEPVQLRGALAEADATLAQKQTEQAVLPSQLRAAEARERVAKADLDGKQSLGGTVASIIIDRAKADWQTAAASVEELKAKQGTLGKEVEALTRKRDAAKRRMEWLSDETRQMADAEAQLQTAQARLKQAEIDRDVAKLRLERMTVRAPMAGRIMTLVARPGTRVMGLAPGAAFDASTVVTMYDPSRLQVRADVRLEDVPQVQHGMKAKIDTPAAPGGSLEGEVLFSTSQADIQKNTLQVKIAIINPPATLRPDMLVQATFLAPPVSSLGDQAAQTLRLLIYRQLVETGEGGPSVWVADQADGVARRKPIQLGAGSGEFVEVISGLTPADRLISGGRDGLRDGARIRVTGEDSSLLSSVGGGKSAALPRLTPPRGQKPN